MITTVSRSWMKKKVANYGSASSLRVLDNKHLLIRSEGTSIKCLGGGGRHFRGGGGQNLTSVNKGRQPVSYRGVNQILKGNTNPICFEESLDTSAADSNEDVHVHKIQS